MDIDVIDHILTDCEHVYQVCVFRFDWIRKVEKKENCGSHVKVP